MRLSARFCLAVSRCVLHSRPVSVSWGGSIRPPRGTAEQGDEEYQAVSSAIGGLLVAQSVSRECPDRMLDLRLRGPEYFGNRAYRRAVAPEIGDPLAEPLLVWPGLVSERSHECGLHLPPEVDLDNVAPQDQGHRLRPILLLHRSKLNR